MQNIQRQQDVIESVSFRQERQAESVWTEYNMPDSYLLSHDLNFCVRI